MEFDAYNLSRAWLSVAVAAADNDDRLALYRTTLIEEFDHGVRLVATDANVLLKAWVPFLGFPDAHEPPLSDMPVSVAVCSDRDRRILGLMKYLAGVTKDTYDVVVDVEIVEGDHETQGTLEGFAASQIRMHASTRYDEAIESPLFEGVFPNWRPLWEGHVWTHTAIVGMSAHTIGKLGKLAGVWGKSNIEFLLGGKVGVIKVLLQHDGEYDGGLLVEGLVMPIALTSQVPESAEVAVEAQIEAFADALDDWLAQVTRMAEPEPEDPEPEE